jgi:hypothetical protein
MIREYRLRLDPHTGEEIWTVECLSIVGEPYYRIHRADGDGLGEDLTVQYLGQTYEGEGYPYRYADGSPFLPYVLYHAERVGDRLFDPYRLSDRPAGRSGGWPTWSPPPSTSPASPVRPGARS